MKTAWTGRVGLLIGVTAVCLLAGNGCKPAAPAASKVKQVEPQLNLPDLSLDEKKLAEKELKWVLASTVGAYEKAGFQNAKWDNYARDALKLFAQVQVYGDSVEGFPDLLSAYCARAVTVGCEDPLVKYLHARFEDKSSLSPAEVLAHHVAAADAMESSSYGEIRKFYASRRALELMTRTNSAVEQRRTYLERTTTHFLAVLNDLETPPHTAYEACTEYHAVIRLWDDHPQRFAQMADLLHKNWGRHGFAWLATGESYVDFAWRARTHQTADKVTDEQWKLFRERMDLAEKELLQGIAVAPQDGRLPTLMIKVAAGQNKGLEEMRRWFDRAMVADPNNYQACSTLLNYLLPRWYGSREAMLAFGRECVNNPKWGGTVPLILADAHYQHNRYDGPSDASYWLEPDVWPDLKLSFETFFKANPKAISWRHNYARYALWCHQWDAFLEQLPLMGDQINYAYFGGEKEFEAMVKQAKANATKKAE